MQMNMAPKNGKEKKNKRERLLVSTITQKLWGRIKSFIPVRKLNLQKEKDWKLTGGKGI